MMEKNIPLHLQELIFSSSDKTLSKQISKLEKEKAIRKIAPRIYTSNFEDKAEQIIKRNIFSILGELYPNAVLSHRSALEFKLTSTDQIFLTYTYTKKIRLPGVTIRFLKGPGPQDGDRAFTGKLYVSQQERAFLENMQVSRQTGSASKILALPLIEAKLEQIARVNGEKGLNTFRDRAKEISEKLSMHKEFVKLNKLISALLSTKPANLLSSSIARARAFGEPYDPKRIELFETLFRHLKQLEFKTLPDKNHSKSAFRNFAFYEAYFSNYIEGTVFELDTAKQIIKTGLPIKSRNDDSHDILGTYHLVSNKKEMCVTPSSPEALIHILQYRHETLLKAREFMKPGQFKEQNYKAGQTHFVDFNLVRGTLIKGLEYYRALKHAFSKAAYMMFMISEVHPFLDGNGRIARVMMNAELVKENESKIIIPTVCRIDYIGALRRLSRKKDPVTYVNMLKRAHEFSYKIIAENMDETDNYLKKCNAFNDDEDSILKF